MTASAPTTPSRDAVVEFNGVGKTFPGHRAVSDLTFRIERGELVSVVGVTGCGKSTMFNLTLGLFPPTDGTVRVEGHDPFSDFNWFRRRVAVVFQDARLLPWRTALQNVCIGMKFAGVDKAEWKPRATDWLRRLGLSGRENAYPHQLSGGQRQRVSLARAFAVDPDVILCDESFSALDEITAKNLRAEFVDLVRSNSKTGIVITHNIGEAMSLGNRVLVLRPPGHLAADIHLDDINTDADRARLREEILTTMDPDSGQGETPSSAATPVGPGDPSREPGSQRGVEPEAHVQGRKEGTSL